VIILVILGTRRHDNLKQAVNHTSVIHLQETLQRHMSSILDAN